MSIKQSLPNMLLVMGLIAVFLVSIPGRTLYAATTAEDVIRGTTSQRSTSTKPDGTTVTVTHNPFSGRTYTETKPDGTSVSTTVGPNGNSQRSTDQYGNTHTSYGDGKGHPTSETWTDPSGYQKTVKYNANGGVVSVDIKYPDGSRDGAHYDGKGNLTSTTSTDPNGLKVIKNCDSANNCKNILERGSSLSSKQGKVDKYSKEPGVPFAGKTFTGVGLGTQKLQTEVLHLNKDKANIQDWSSSAASSGFGQGQHKRHR
jgi:hypothetical protein